MVTTLKVLSAERGKMAMELACLSTDTKPVGGVLNGSICMEIDTGDMYMFDEASTTWKKIGG